MDVIDELIACCEAWEPEVCVMGNVRAGEAAKALRGLRADLTMAGAFHKAAVAQRNAAWAEVAGLRAELAKADGQINRCVDQNRYLERLLSEAARDVSIVSFLRCGGWEVLQNPKYWTPENKFFGAIAEAMAEVAMAGGENV